ncbi:unnamed protein product [Dovyalis caffra]|uniref:Enoyl-CoA hydratase n=1 Tax=Dovyalis caffra TaxID=77055 RepID=A0AAV1RHM7_9ROSI|nr:unnamed protein product [Dovyalis caffra]
MEHYRTLRIFQKSPNSGVFHLNLNRQSQRNALSRDFFTEFPIAFQSLDQNPNASVILLSGTGDHFCSGIDINTLNSTADDSGDRGRSGEKLRRDIKFLQDAITAIERCRKPVIAAIKGACIGGADLGTLQRLPGIVGFGNAMELALTGRRFSGQEAKELGLVSRVFGSKEELDEGVRIIAEGIAAKSPLAVTGTKAVLLRSRDASLEQGLDYVATWNSAMLLSEDLREAVSAHLQKRKPTFSKL